MRIAVCEDDKREQEYFMDVLHDWSPSEEADCFLDGVSLLEAVKNGSVFQVAFLDVYMPDVNGVDIARALRETSPETQIVFVTNSKEHAVEAFELHALHYLIKPVTEEKIAEVFRRLSKYIPINRSMVHLTVGRETHNVYLDEIYYVQSVNHAVEVFLTRERRIKVWISLGEMEKKLDGNFLRINRGTIVNMAYIEMMGIDTCILQDGTKLELTRRVKSRIRAAYDDYIFAKLSERTVYETRVEL